MMPSHEPYVSGCNADRDSCRNKGTYHCESCSRRTRWLLDFYERCCPNCQSNFIEYYVPGIYCQAHYDFYSYEYRSVKRNLCPVCDKDFIDYMEWVKDGGAIVSFVSRKNVPEEFYKKYTVVIQADGHPEIFERENLYLSFR